MTITQPVKRGTQKTTATASAAAGVVPANVGALPPPRQGWDPVGVIAAIALLASLGVTGYLLANEITSSLGPAAPAADSAAAAPAPPPPEAPAGKLLLTKEQLAGYKGITNGSPLYVAILGQVFDVSSKADTYGPEQGYHHFVGVDGTRAFISGEFQEDITDEVSDFDGPSCLGLLDWRDFYHKTYPYVGDLVGAFYDEGGAPTPRLAWVERQAEVGRRVKAEMARAHEAYPSCNMKYTEAEGGFVWCDGGHYPRKLFLEMEGGQPSWRCACFEELGWSDLRMVYPDCSPEATRCQVSPPQAAA